MDANQPQGFFPTGNTSEKDRYTNPFYNIPNQYMPQNIDGMLQWAEHFLFRNGFYKQALNRVANYFITALSIECDDEEAKKTYEETFEQLDWKGHCGRAGLNLLAYGNNFTSINQGFERFLICPKCEKTVNLDKFDDFEFDKNKYTMTCVNANCKFKGVFRLKDIPSTATEKIHLVHWPAREIKSRYEDTTGEAEYFWDIPQQYAKKVTTKNNKFFSKKTPAVIFECIMNKQMLRFNSKNFLHLKLDTPCTIRTDGKAIPPSMFLFEDLFMLQTLKRYNEVICFEDIAPFRVISMADGSGNPASAMLMHQSGDLWSAHIDSMITEHRRDPGSYHKCPFPVNYAQFGGEGKQLAPQELMEQARNAILNALDIPVEMFQMTFQQQAAGPMLRMFENAHSVVPMNYNRLLNHLGKVVASILGLPPAKISLIPITFSDDMERKSIVGQLVSANAIARSEMLKLYNFDYSDQIRKVKEEERIRKDIEEEEKEKDEIAQMTQSNMQQMLQQGAGNNQVGTGGQIGGAGGAAAGGGGGGTPQDALEKAQQIAQELFPQDGAARRTQLQQIKAQDQDLYALVKSQLEQMTSQAKSQGLQSSKQPQQ